MLALLLRLEQGGQGLLLHGLLLARRDFGGRAGGLLMQVPCHLVPDRKNYVVSRSSDESFRERSKVQNPAFGTRSRSPAEAPRQLARGLRSRIRFAPEQLAVERAGAARGIGRAQLRREKCPRRA